VHLRRTLYLTIMSSANYEEAGHKLMKVGLQPGQEPELCRMIIDCCSQERTFLRFYALLAQRFCVKFFSYRYPFLSVILRPWLLCCSLS
jgi:pre-mRNA-splicing factor CWC22